MSIVTKTLLDHVLIQFAHGAEHQLKKPGEIEGAQFAEIEYLIDDATGAVVGKTTNTLNGQPQVLDPAKISDVIGGQFATVAAQLDAAQKELAAAKATIVSRDAFITRLRSQFATFTAQFADPDQETKTAN